MLFAYVKIPKFWSNVTTSGDIIKKGKKESYLNWMEEKKAYVWSFVESKKTFTGFWCMETASYRADYQKFLTCFLTKRLSRVSILKWPLKHLHVFFKQSAEVLKPSMETRGSVRCFKRSTSVFLSIWVFIHKHSGFTEQQGEREATTISPLYHFQPLQRHLEISQL